LLHKSTKTNGDTKPKIKTNQQVIEKLTPKHWVVKCSTERNSMKKFYR